ncbi:MAG: glutamate--tRNA ligase [Actinomycetota bacterium]|nr:glutamate--tRNA ligase [Actinomycetota bacterium]
MSLRVRIAPAPSGSLHVGNVRTFLFVWLFARKHGATFILRIEDTDKARYTEEAYEAALQDLRWLGLDWDEGPEVGGDHGPYRQSERAARHHDVAMGLLESGAAYKCYCTKQELAERNELARAEGRKPGYDGRCFALTASERAERDAAGVESVVRFHVPEGKTEFDDLVIGHVVVDHEQIDDFVIMRSDGSTLYHLGVVVDDGDMDITHVIRGDDHLSNTPKQILMHQALGNQVPTFGHVPQVFGSDGKPLSKRHGSTSVAEFRDGGYLSDALFNFLAFLGWGTADDAILSKEELIERFEITDVHASPARFDFVKLDWMNGEYIRMLEPQVLEGELIPFLAAQSLIDEQPTESQAALVKAIVPLVQTRIERLDMAPGLVRGIFRDVEIDPGAFEKVMKQDFVPALLDASTERLNDLQVWSLEGIEAALRDAVGALELKARTGFVPLYVAISGSSKSAPLFDSMFLIGKDESLKRLMSAKLLVSG